MLRNPLFAILIPALFVSIAFSACKPDPKTQGDPDLFQLLLVRLDGASLSTTIPKSDASITPELTLEFTAAVDTTLAKSAITLSGAVSRVFVPLRFVFENGNRMIRITPVSPLDYLTEYQFQIGETLQGAQKQPFPGLSYRFTTLNGTMTLVSATLQTTNILGPTTVRNVSYQNATFTLRFSEELSAASFATHFTVSPSVALEKTLSTDRKTVTIRVNQSLSSYTRHTFSVSNTLTSEAGKSFAGFTRTFVSGLNPEPKFPILSDEELMDKVQSQTFKYFWDFGHPVSGLARERNSSGETVTIGGSGFGIMGIVVGIHRGFITRTEGVQRLDKIVTFLGNADRFHGVWPHWMNGSTGARIAFSQYDNGGDLVETSFMAQGLTTVRQYLNSGDPTEAALISKINTLLATIEWSWYRRDGQNTLYWHWSPEHAWRMNMQVQGYNEALITYFMAATSSTHGIPKIVYDNGWARNGAIRNGNTYYGIQLPVGFSYGGPLFFAHYSFLGLDPRNLADQYATYWTQNRNHSLIHYEHGVRNPNGHVGYSADSWGLTASDESGGYGVHEPTRDNGTISPTAALSSIPYTPVESMRAMRHFYHVLGDKLWGPYGFYDAFRPNDGWWANSTLAIDQGPILIMIENHRSGLLWDLFMSAP
ncbi:MAG: hypothetical protein RL177_665, partial [Bacteroidota bacterium]